MKGNDVGSGVVRGRAVHAATQNIEPAETACFLAQDDCQQRRAGRDMSRLDLSRVRHHVHPWDHSQPLNQKANLADQRCDDTEVTPRTHRSVPAESRDPQVAQLDRWIAAGGEWRVLSRAGDEIVVALLTCDGGEEMERITSSEFDFLEFVAAAEVVLVDDGAIKPRPRWFTDTDPGHSQNYIERMRGKARDNEDLHGEARLIDALVPPGSRVLDAGCGPGRTSGALHRRGHTVVGVDADPELIAAAQEDHPGPRWVVADLSELALDTPEGAVEKFDIVVCAGNVLVFVASGTERRVLERLAAHVRPGGRIVTGFRREGFYPFAQFDQDAVAVGLEIEHRFATWDLRLVAEEDEFRVTVLRVPDLGA